MPPGYHHSGCVATHALEHMMYGYSLLVPMNQRVLSKLSKEHNISKWSWVIHDTQSAQISQKQDERNIYAIMKTMCPPGYHHNGFMATHARGHMMYGCTMLFRSKFAQKWILSSECQNSKSKFEISSSKIPCVPIFRQNGQFWLFWPKFVQKWILALEFQKSKSKLEISSSKIPYVPIFT